MARNVFTNNSDEMNLRARMMLEVMRVAPIWRSVDKGPIIREIGRIEWQDHLDVLHSLA